MFNTELTGYNSHCNENILLQISFSFLSESRMTSGPAETDKNANTGYLLQIEFLIGLGSAPSFAKYLNFVNFDWKLKKILWLIVKVVTSLVPPQAPRDSRPVDKFEKRPAGRVVWLIQELFLMHALIWVQWIRNQAWYYQ